MQNQTNRNANNMIKKFLLSLNYDLFELVSTLQFIRCGILTMKIKLHQLIKFHESIQNKKKAATDFDTQSIHSHILLK